MKRRFAARVNLLLSVLIIIGSAELPGLGTAARAGDDNRTLAQLFNDMLIVQFPEASEPVDFRLEDADGRPLSISEFRGRVVFLNFWTTWCPSCRIEMPSMEKLHQTFKDGDFAMVTINLQESPSRVKEFFKEFKLTFTALLDTGGEVGIMFGVNQIPTTYILDKKGRIIGKAMGSREWNSKESTALFKHLIRQQAAASTSNAIN